MTLQIVCVFVSVVLVLVQCNILDFTRQLTPDDYYCGQLLCKANSSQPIFNIAIYETTVKGNPVKLASISVLAPVVSVDPPKVQVINATGTISKYNGILNVRFSRDIDCLYGTFRCESEFVNVNGQPDVIKESLASAVEINVTLLFSLAKIVSQMTKTNTQISGLKQDSEALKQDNEILKQDNEALQQNNEGLETMLDSALVELSIIKELVNSTRASDHDKELVNSTPPSDHDKELVNSTPPSDHDKELVTSTRPSDHDKQNGSSCYRGMPHKSPRVKFLLLGYIPAMCDAESDGGGWAVIQRRVLGADFYKGWADYKKGFGTPESDYWIGNDIIHNLTSQGYNELRVDFNHSKTAYFAQYTNFTVGDELSGYLLRIGGYSGNVYDGMAYHNGNKFSTFDRDNDQLSGSCAVKFHGAWWYNACQFSNLNAAWAVSGTTGTSWRFSANDALFNLSFTEMKVRYNKG